MNIKKKTALLVFLAWGVTTGKSAQKQAPVPPEKVETTEPPPAVLWHDPGNMADRSLYYGPGGKKHEPHGKFTFDKEDMNGTTPKFTVIDEDGVKWKVKLGSEARPETVATRLVWAMGYSADEDYFVPDLHVAGAIHLHRGENMMTRDGTFQNVRLKRERKDKEKMGTWQWHDNPFNGTRELLGLRVLMAVINNWDLKDENNAVYLEKGDADSGFKRVYLISDLGASFGANGLDVEHNDEKGKLEVYQHSGFIHSLSNEGVSFDTPRRPALPILFNPPEFISRLNLRWIGRDIPREDAEWVGQLLARLSHDQIRDAFRAGGYAPTEVEGFSQILEQRITKLNHLSEDSDDIVLRP